jgi:TP901 family phage tail tape measure protein
VADFTSAITLKFNDLFSNNFLQARHSLLDMQSTLNGLNATGIERVNTTLSDLSTSAIAIPTPEIGRPAIPTPDNPRITIPVPEIPQPTIPTPDGSLFRRGLAEIQSGLDKIAENNALNTLATQLSTMSLAMGPIQQSLNGMMEQPSKLAGTFESSLKNIQAITGNTNEEMAVLNRQLLEIGKNAVAGPQGVVDAMNDIAGGVDNAESHLGILNGAILLAEAGQADLGAAANGLVSIMNAYSLASGDAASATVNAISVSDVLTQTVGQGVGSMEAFIRAFSQVSGLSASVGVGFDEVGSALAFITTQGPSASEAATQLKAAETALLNPNKTLAEALQSIGIASGSAMLAQYGLVESLNIINHAVGGSQDAMAKALGSTEALNGATALLGSGYTDFAAKFGAALESSVTAEAVAIQNQSYESKLARMEAATQVLQLQIGDNINAIKGQFLELGAGFLTNVVSPIMSSPIGEVFQEVAAFTGVAGQGLLSFGGTALTTATQFTTLAANIKNAGGYAKIFHGAMTIMQVPFKSIGSGLASMGRGITSAGSSIAGTLPRIGQWITSMWTVEAAHRTGTAIRAFPSTIQGVGRSIAQTIPKLGLWISSMGKMAAVNAMPSGKSLWSGIVGGIAGVGRSFIGALPAVGAWIASGWATAAAWIAATWPILAVVAAIGLVALGVYALIKNWDSVAAFFIGLWNKIVGVFTGAWNGIKSILSGLPNWIVGLLAVFFPLISLPLLIITNWDTIKGFFASLWSGITTAVSQFVNWLGGIWGLAVSGFTSAWSFVFNFFVSLWSGITTTVSNFANWLGGIWGFAVSGFTSAWGYVYNFFVSIWDGIKSVVIGFIEWISGAIEFIIAPFLRAGEIIGGFLGSIGGFFKGLIGESESAGVKINENLTPSAQVNPVEPINTNAIAPTETATLAIAQLNTQNGLVTTADLGQPISTPIYASNAANPPPIPGSGLEEVISPTQFSTFAATAQSPAFTEQLPGLSPAKMNSPAVSYQSTGAFESALGVNKTLTPSVEAAAIPGVDMDDFNRQAAVTFQAAMPAPTRSTPAEHLRQTPERTANTAPSIKIERIENLNFQAEECRTLFDFMKMFMLAVQKPESEAV